MKMRRGRDAAVSAAAYTAARGAMRRCLGLGGDGEVEACCLPAVRRTSGCINAPALSLVTLAAGGDCHLGATAAAPGRLHLLRCSCWSMPEIPAEAARTLCFPAAAAPTACEEEEAVLALGPLNGTVDSDAQVAGSTAAKAEAVVPAVVPRLDDRAAAEAEAEAEAGGALLRSWTGRSSSSPVVDSLRPLSRLLALLRAAGTSPGAASVVADDAVEASVDIFQAGREVVEIAGRVGRGADLGRAFIGARC